MTRAPLRRASYAVLAAGTVATGALVLGEVGLDRGAIGVVAWCTVAYGLAAGATWAFRASRRALVVLLGAWVVVVGASLWVVGLATAWSRSDMSGLLLLWVPAGQVPAVGLAALAAWAVRREPSP